uniref:Uncharacterized protein n=1 Tax=Graphocephala atropunctata TaxID=36148 RepID=A0A1B6M5Y3_9HEMI
MSCLTYLRLSGGIYVVAGSEDRMMTDSYEAMLMPSCLTECCCLELIVEGEELVEQRIYYVKFEKPLLFDSILSKTSKTSASFTSVRGSKFGRSVAKYAKKNDPGLVQTLSTVNSRVIRTVFNLSLPLDLKLPDLTQHEATNCIRALGKSLKILDYEFNYSSFWLLDTLSKMIKDMQLKNVSVSDQNTFLVWFSFVLRCISVTGASREETFQFLEDLFKKAVKIIYEGNPIPKPENIECDERKMSHKPSTDSKSLLSLKSFTGSESSNNKRKSSSSQKSSKKPSTKSSKSRKTLSSSFSKTSSLLISAEEKVNMNLDAFYTFIKMIYEVFGDRFVYSVVSEVYSSPVLVTPVDVHLDFLEPKPPKPEPVSLPPDRTTPRKEGGIKKKDKNPRSSSKVPGPDIPPAETETEKQKKSKGKKGVKEDEGKPKKDKGSKIQTKATKGLAKELSEGKKTGKGNKPSRKPKKSSSLHSVPDPQKLMLEARIKEFDRVISPEMKLEAEKLTTKDKYILPLADTVDSKFVENLVRSLIPTEEKPIEELKPKGGKGKDKMKSSMKESKKKDKDKKKNNEL